MIVCNAHSRQTVLSGTNAEQIAAKNQKQNAGKIVEMDQNDGISKILFLSIAGAVAGIFLFLDGKEAFTWRAIIGRAGSSAMTGAAAAAIWIPYPAAHILSVIGIACFLGSFGTERLERIARRVWGKE